MTALRARFIVQLTAYLFSALVLLGLATASHASIQDYRVSQWTTVNGLPSQSVRAVVQDKRGYLWVGTQFGLSRFDGHKFTNFHNNQTINLQSNAINTLFMDSQGYLWIGTKKGLSGLDPRSLSFTQYNIKGAVSDIVEDKQGHVWIAAEGLFRVHNGQVMPVSQVVGSVTHLALQDDALWVLNNRSLLKLNIQYSANDESVRLELDKVVALPTELAQAIVYDMGLYNGQVFLGSELGAYFLDRDDTVRVYRLPGNEARQVYKLYADQEGGLWISAYDRLYYRRNNEPWEWVAKKQLGHRARFSDVFQSQDGSIWLASFSEGLWQAYPGYVSRYLTTTSDDDAIASVQIAQDGRLWASSQLGVGYFNENRQFITQIPYQALRRKAVHDLYFTDNKLFLATDAGAYIFQDAQLTPVDNYILQNTPVRTIQPAAKGGIWFGTVRGLYLLNYKGLQAYAFNALLASQYITFVVDSAKGGWLGTSQGAYQFTENSLERAGAGTELDRSHITSILDVPDRAVLFGTLEDGLFIRQEHNKWSHIDSANGLPYGDIVSLFHDKETDWLWLSTSRGLYRVRLTELLDPAGSLHVEQVLAPHERQLGTEKDLCCAGSGSDAVAVRDGSLWYPTPQGVLEVPLKLKLAESPALTPRFERIETANRVMVVNPDLPVSLATDERDITIAYTAINYSPSQELEFRYKLLGVDSNWRYAQGRREAIFTNLPAGRFVLQLEVKTKNGNWQDAQAVELKFTVPKLFKETVVYRLLIGALVFLVLYVVFVMYRSQERRKQLALERLVDARTKALKESNEKLNEVNQQLKDLSHADELTGLRSRRYLFDQVPKDVEHYQRNRDSLQSQGKTIALLVINLDKFSALHDSYGTVVADSVLQQVGAILNSTTRGSDYVVRWQGDQFVLLLRDIQMSTVFDYAKHVNGTIAETEFNTPTGGKVAVTCSIGLALYPLPLLGGQIIDWEVSLSLAEMALLKVKADGRNGVGQITFDEQVDAFEFEDIDNIEKQVESLLFDDLAKFEVWLNPNISSWLEMKKEPHS